jgi:hypothetical protein
MEIQSEHLRVRQVLHATDPYSGLLLKDAQIDIQGWHSSDPIFARLVAEVRPTRIIEVGTWKGASAIGMAKLTKEHGLKTEIVCIDTWLGALEFWTSHDDPTRYGSLMLRNGYPAVYYTFAANVVLSGHADSITPFPQTSLNGARWFGLHGLQADLIYIDGSHEEADVLADVIAFWQVLRPGGVIFGDDFSGAWPSVVRAVRSFAQHNGLRLEEENEFWIIRKPAVASGNPIMRPESSIQTTRPVLLVHAAESARSKVTPFVERLGYHFVDLPEIGSSLRAGSALWIPPGGQIHDEENEEILTEDAQSLFWVEQSPSAESTHDWWCRWNQSFNQRGGGDRVVALHPYQPLLAQRHRCELLCRRLGVDLSSIQLVDSSAPCIPAPVSPGPGDHGFDAQLEMLIRLGISPQEFFSFTTLHRIEVRSSDIHFEKPAGAIFEPYSPSHFLLHPPEQGHGWMRLYFRDLELGSYRFFMATLSLPSVQAPSVRFQWCVFTTDGMELQRSEIVLEAGETRSWVVPLPERVPANCVALLATRVEGSLSNAFAWATWRDPILFS